MNRQVVAVVEGLTAPGRDSGSKQGSVEELFTRIISWRRSRVDEALAAAITERLAQAAAEGRPVEFSVPFGGYKAWHQASYPHVNWAEVMWLKYLRRFGEDIAALHEPGVAISLSCYGNAMDLVNNLPLDDQQTYLAELTEIAFRLRGPRVTLHVVDLAELHGGAEKFRADLLGAVRNVGEPDEAHLSSAARNLLPRGVRALDDDGWRSAVWESARVCMALESLPERRQFNKFGPRIQITHQRGPSLSLHLGSTRASTMQPWVGTGYLAPGNDGLVEHIASRLPDVREYSVSHSLDDFPTLTQIPVAR